MNRRIHVAVLVVLVAAFLPRPARATTYQWDGGLSHGTSADANWTTGSNWVGGVAPASSLTGTDTVFLGTASRTTSNNNNALPSGIAVIRWTSTPATPPTR